jgi:hypothetical protein
MTTHPFPTPGRPQRSGDNDPGGVGPPATHGVAGGRPGMAYRHVTFNRW